MHYKTLGKFILLFWSLFFPGLFLISSPVDAVSLDKIKLNGYIDLEYRKASNDQGNENGSFDQRHFNFLFEASPGERFTVKGHIEFEHGLGTSLADGDILLEWAYGEYFVTDYLKIRGGKILTPYGFYSVIRDATPAYLFVDVPGGVYNTTHRGGTRMLPKWSTGLSLLGEYFVSEEMSMDYSVYLGNGESLSGTNEAQFDDNKDKSLGGFFQVHPGLNVDIGFSVFNNQKAIDENINQDHTTYGLSAAFNLENFNLTGEFFQSEFGDTDEKAFYLMASYSIANRLTPFIIYDYLDPDSSVANDYWKDLGGGINLKLTEGLFFKLEYHHNYRGDNNSAVSNNKRSFNEVKSTLTATF